MNIQSRFTPGSAGDHAPSYYAATLVHQTDYPRLQGAVQADVCVVGGGFTGVSAALHLVQRGYSVVLLEAHRIGWGATGRNGGQLIGGFADHEKIARRQGPEAGRVVWEMGIECNDIVREHVERWQIACDLKWGFFDAAMKPRELEALRARAEDWGARGYPHDLQLVSGDELPGVIGSRRYIGGLLDSGNGHLHPLNLCIGEARAAAGLGVRIFERSPAEHIGTGPQRLVRTAHGEVRCEFVVLAGNAYLGGLVKALRGRVLPAGSYIIATEPLSRAIREALLPLDTAVCDQRTALDYFRLSADGRLLFGGMCNYSGRDPKDIAGVLVPRMLNVFPQLAGVRIDYQWGGYIGISVKRIPQLGRLGSHLYYAQGYSGHGVAPTHLAGKVLAEAIAGQSERFDIFAREKHWRLPGGRWFASPLLALGMLYYRLRDAL